MPNSFAKKLAESLKKPQKPEFRKAYDALRKIVDGIREALLEGRPSGALEVALEPGYTTNLGQQFRIQIYLPGRKWHETLFRAYIPPDGFPVSLDLDGEEPITCNTVAAVEKQVLTFLQKPEIHSRLNIVRESM